MSTSVVISVYVQVPDLGEVEFYATATVTWGYAPRVGGPPEDCYEGEPDSVEWDDTLELRDYPTLYGVAAKHIWSRDEVELLKEWELLLDADDEDCDVRQHRRPFSLEEYDGEALCLAGEKHEDEQVAAAEARYELARENR